MAGGGGDLDGAFVSSHVNTFPEIYMFGMDIPIFVVKLETLILPGINYS